MANKFTDFTDVDYYSYSGAENWDNVRETQTVKPIIARVQTMDGTDIDIVADKNTIQVNVFDGNPDDDMSVFAAYHSLPKEMVIAACEVLYNTLEAYSTPKLWAESAEQGIWRRIS